MPTQATMPTREIRRILKRHPGTIAGIARDLNITISSVSMYLRGKGTSARIAEAAQTKALELIEKENAARVA